MKRLFDMTAWGVVLMLASAAPSLAKSPKTTQPVDNAPVVTPDTTPPPAGTAAPTGAVQVSPPGPAPEASAPYTIPIGRAQAQPQTASQPAPSAAPAPPVPQGPPEPVVMARADQCLRANVERVSHAEPSAKLATDLLLADVCAAEVDAASLYARNVDALARFNPVSERGRAGLSTAHVDETTGQIVAPPSVDVSAAIEAAERSALTIAPSLRKLAAELVLSQTLRLTAPPSHVAAPVKPVRAKKGH